MPSATQIQPTVKTTPAEKHTAEGATVVITHRVREGEHAGYEDWLNEIGPVSRSFPGQIDWQIIRPIPGLSGTYTVVLRFDTLENLHGWMHSPQRRDLIAKVQPLLTHDDDFFIRSGLDFWFTPEGARATVPVRWKQALVTWSAIFPLVLLISPLAVAALRALGLPASRPLDTLLVTGLLVLLMVYVVMPRYTRLVSRWLFA